MLAQCRAYSIHSTNALKTSRNWWITTVSWFSEKESLPYRLRGCRSNNFPLLRLSAYCYRDSGYFCIANFNTEKTAQKFIKKFNRKSPYGHPLNIREFVHRSYGNERRAINWRTKEWEGDDKRVGERRTFIAQTTLVDNL